MQPPNFAFEEEMLIESLPQLLAAAWNYWCTIYCLLEFLLAEKLKMELLISLKERK